MTIKLKWLGHSSFQIKAAGKTIYIDPYEGEYTEKADLMLATHSHFDHCDTSKINGICKSDTVVIAPFALTVSALQKAGGSVKLLKAGEETAVGNIKIKAVEAYNIKRFRSPGNPFHPKGLGVGYLITVEGKTIYHAGDTDFIPEMKNLGHVDVALLPSGDTYTMDNADAAEAALAIKPNVAIPMHRWDSNPDEFKKKVATDPCIMVVALSKGGELVI
jgi:L-ascorbate metabolism protein UlaG (beta-lactamase superfamily)